MIKINFTKFFKQLAALFGAKGKPPVFTPPSVPVPTPVPVPDPEPTLPTLNVRDAFFVQEDGQSRTPFTIIECSDFRLFKMWLDGEDIEQILVERVTLGFNMVRVFGMCKNLFDLDPRNYPDYFTKLTSFVRFCAAHRLYVEFVVFPDVKLINDDTTWQLAHWTQVGIALDLVWRWVIIELQNEADQPPNQMDTAAFEHLGGTHICSHGSQGSQAPPIRPWWEYETFHTNDAFEWHRKSSHNAMELSEGTEGVLASHVPILTNEQTRPDRDNNLIHFEDSARACRLLIAGSCFHSLSGRNSDKFSEFDLPFAQAFVKGASDQSVDLNFQTGHYVHDSHWEGPDDLRVYRRVNESGYAEVRIRK